MKLIIDGFEVKALPEQSLLDIIKEMGLVTGKLSTDPIAAKIAGDVFTLNYIPLREKDVRPTSERVRQAVAASNGEIRLLRYSDSAGAEVYTRTAQFVLFLALRQLWPRAVAKMNCTVGAALYKKEKHEKVNDFIGFYDVNCMFCKGASSSHNYTYPARANS